MPFEWCESDPGPPGGGQKARQMYRLELAERAAMLHRLGYSQQAAVSRLLSNVVWDFELHQQPPHLAEVERIVAEVYERRGLAGGGPPALEH